jgi:hypothetical protein
VYQYFIDRWCLVDWSGNNDGTLTLTNDGISVANEEIYFYQRFPSDYIKSGKRYTLAVYYADSNIAVLPRALREGIEVKESYVQLAFGVQPGTTVSSVALYEGEYTIDTLPEYQPKGYEQELLICSQYDPSTGEYVGLRKFGQPRNLLDNSDFTNPVNQRGFVSGSELPTYTYFLDRWKNGQVVCSPVVDYNGISNITGAEIQQFLDLSKYIGKTLTMVVYTDYDNPAYFCSGVITNNSSWIVLANTPNWECAITCQGTNMWAVQISIDCKYVALYEGEYTIDTIPNYQPKGYGVELIECKRYYQRVGKLQKTGAIALGFCYQDAATARFVMPISPMRKINPTVTLVSTSDTPSVICNGSYIARGNLEFTAGIYEDDVMMSLVVTVNNGVANAPALLLGNSSVWFELSADW